MSSKNRKLQVFVSSTYEDLKEERQAAVQAILNAGHIPAGMELFAAGDKSQMDIIKEWIEESDVYLLILGGRYGTIEPESGRSYIHLEYEYAVNLRKPLFSIVINQEALEKKNKEVGSKVLELENPDKFRDFRKIVMSKMVRPWDDLKDIRLSVFESLAEFSKREELIGWVRGDQAVDSGLLAEELARSGKENSELRHELEHLYSLSANNFFGVTFDSLFQALESNQYSLDEIRKFSSITQRVKSQKLFDRLESLSKTDLVNGNDMIMAFSPLINGVDDTHPDNLKGFFNLLQLHGLVKFTETINYGQIKVCSEFTEEGRKYLFQVRSLEKYKDWNYENQIR